MTQIESYPQMSIFKKSWQLGRVDGFPDSQKI